MNCEQLIRKLACEQRLTLEQWQRIFSEYDGEDIALAMELARKTAVSRFGKRLWFRGIVEFSNICRQNCFYCGIRRDNHKVCRYRQTPEEILECCAEGYEGGFRTFVLQGGEDGWFTDERMCAIVRDIKARFPDCAVTLSLGERSRESYQALFDAGADRYLLRHETADEAHYRMLHPADQTLQNRLRCLRDLKEIGYQTGCGIMVGSPGQTPAALARDMVFMQEFAPEMIGVGPFLPHRDTPLSGEPAGSVELTLLVLALCRLMLPDVLLPATTALGTAQSDGRIRGVLAGCNVVMPNLSPAAVRKHYMLYDNKAGTGMTPEQSVRLLQTQMAGIGYEVAIGRGDYQKTT